MTYVHLLTCTTFLHKGEATLLNIKTLESKVNLPKSHKWKHKLNTVYDWE